ncbi:MAG TPA: hypothetical protein VHT02_08675 [Methylocella sp.]|nr:hypothetical protein [Methylocella sp.]
MTTTFPEVDRFVTELREHYRRRGVPNGDAIADVHGEWVYGMYHASTAQSEFLDHFDSLLAIYRQNISFEEKRTRLSEHLDLAKVRKH